MDRSIGLLVTGYPYLLELRSTGRAVAEIRILGRPATVVSGPSGTRLFYDDTIMRRRDAVPRPLAATLFGGGAVHSLDGAVHRRRKQMFVELLTPDNARILADAVAAQWRERMPATIDPEAVFDHAVQVHCAAVCAWAGVPESRVHAQLGRDLATIVEGFGSVGPRYVRAARPARRLRNPARSAGLGRAAAFRSGASYSAA